MPKQRITNKSRSAPKKKVLSAAELTKIILDNRYKDRTDILKEKEIKNKQFSKEIKQLSKIVRNVMDSYVDVYDNLFVNIPFYDSSIIEVHIYNTPMTNRMQPIISLKVTWIGLVDEELRKIAGASFINNIGVEYEYILEDLKKKGIWIIDAEEDFKNHIALIMADIIQLM